MSTIPTTNFYFFRPSLEVLHLATSVVADTGTPSLIYPASLISRFDSPLYEAKPAMLDGVGGGSWVFGFSGNQRIDFVLWWHDGDPGVVLRWQGNASNAWGGPTLNAPFTCPAKYEDGYTVMGFTDLRTVSGYTTSGFPFWRAVFPANSIPPGLKLLAYSQGNQLNNHFRVGLHRGRAHYSSDQRTDRQLPWVYDKQGARNLLMADLPMDVTDRATVASWKNDCNGHRKVTAVIPDPTVNEVIIGRFMNSPAISQSSSSGGVSAQIMDVVSHPSGSRNLHTVSIGIEGLTPGSTEW